MADENIFLPEEASNYRPKELKEQLVFVKEDMERVVDQASRELDQLNRIIGSLPAIISLRHIHDRLSKAPFSMKLNDILDHEMMTMAFVVAYTRVVRGGRSSSGIEKGQIPTYLRQAHQDIIDVRNQRYAHNDGHQSLHGGMFIDLENGEFKVGAQFSMEYYVQGADEWGKLVDFLDDLMFDRIQRQIDKIKAQTGRDWSFVSGTLPVYTELTTG